MARNTEIVPIGEKGKTKDVVVKEVPVKRILEALPFDIGGKKEKEELEAGFMAKMKSLLQESTGLSGEEFLDLCGSEMEELWEAFRRVNAFFFKILGHKLLEKPMQGFLNTVGPACGEMFVDLLKEDTPTVSTTGSAGS